ncbi:MAG: hypothetical protein KBF88_04025 [Polyangiaceae bacterium]|nr:hypothetical protein [Polyangiaceae bacterium]
MTALSPVHSQPVPQSARADIPRLNEQFAQSSLWALNPAPLVPPAHVPAAALPRRTFRFPSMTMRSRCTPAPAVTYTNPRAATKLSPPRSTAHAGLS